MFVVAISTILEATHTLSLNDERRQSQSSSSDDLVLEWAIAVLFQQNLPSHAFVPVKKNKKAQKLDKSG